MFGFSKKKSSQKHVLQRYTEHVYLINLFLLALFRLGVHRKWDRRLGVHRALSSNISPRVFRSTRAPVNAGHQFHFVSKERARERERDRERERERFRNSFPSRYSVARFPSIEKAKRKTDDFTLALGNSSACLGDLSRNPGSSFLLLLKEQRYFKRNEREREREL